jgi:hypothetical protein
MKILVEKIGELEKKSSLLPVEQQMKIASCLKINGLIFNNACKSYLRLNARKIKEILNPFIFF